MCRGTDAQFLLGLGQGNVQAPFPGSRASDQEFDCDGGLAGPWIAFQQEKSLTFQATRHDVVKPGDPERRLPFSITHDERPPSVGH